MVFDSIRKIWDTGIMKFVAYICMSNWGK